MIIITADTHINTGISINNSNQGTISTQKARLSSMETLILKNKLVSQQSYIYKWNLYTWNDDLYIHIETGCWALLPNPVIHIFVR